MISPRKSKSSGPANRSASETLRVKSSHESISSIAANPGTQAQFKAQFSVSLGSQTGEKNALHELIVWITEHLDKDLSIPVLASRTAMSPRNFHRVFTSGAGKSPARYVEELRIETARRLLERTTQSIDEIADHCGFGSSDVLARAFTRVLQVTPGEYRSRFRSSRI